MKRALVPASLLLLAACQQPGPAVPRPYAAAEEGLTLVYINPSLPQDQQAAQRVQVRVDKVTDHDGAKVVAVTSTQGLAKPVEAVYTLKDGAAALLSPDGKSEASMLPKGFPGQVENWMSDEGARCHIMGRGQWLQGDKVLPPDRPHEGVWVDAQLEKGGAVMHTRTLYVSGLGAVQTDAQQADGRWLTVNLLTQYGFTDLPASAEEAPKAAEKHPAKRKR